MNAIDEYLLCVWDEENIVTLSEWETPFADRRWGRVGNARVCL